MSMCGGGGLQNLSGTFFEGNVSSCRLTSSMPLGLQQNQQELGCAVVLCEACTLQGDSVSCLTCCVVPQL